MSNRPGIGSYAMDDIADAFLRLKQNYIDVPTVANYQGRAMPLGRYLLSNLRKKAGINEEIAKRYRMVQASEFMQDLQRIQDADLLSQKEAYQKKYAQEILNWKSRRKIKNRKVFYEKI